ncbi:MAG: PfkB family carbohydrate kinase [Bacteroidota bacterium]
MPAPILVVGEVLWDSLPSGLFLGGASHNVACHLHQLGVDAVLASRVGGDALGREAVRRVAARGLSADLLQTDPALPTGFVHVEMEAGGIPAYDIMRPAAWDAIAATEALVEAASSARALVFGTLAQREETSRQTLRALWKVASLHVCDINLRPPYVSREVVEASLRTADLAKLNDDEVETLAGWYGLGDDLGSATQRLAEQFEIATVCVTRGPRGALLLREGVLYEHPGYPAAVADTVGAGDAFLAALLAALLDDVSAADALDRANRLGAFVAGALGAIPPYDPAAVFAPTPA